MANNYRGMSPIQKLQHLLYISIILSAFALGLSLNRKLGMTTFWVLPSTFPVLTAFHVILFRRLKQESAAARESLPNPNTSGASADPFALDKDSIITNKRTIIAAWLLATIWLILLILTIINPIVLRPWWGFPGTRIVGFVLESLSVALEFVVLLLIADLCTLEWRILGRVGRIALPEDVVERDERPIVLAI